MIVSGVLITTRNSKETREYIDGLQSVETVLADLVEHIAITARRMGRVIA